MVGHGQVHKTSMTFGCLSLVHFLLLTVPEWGSCIQILSGNVLGLTSSVYQRHYWGGLARVSGVLVPWIFKSAVLRSSHTRFPESWFNLRCLIRCAVTVKAVVRFEGFLNIITKSGEKCSLSHMGILHPDYSLCETLLLWLKAQPWESESWVSHPDLSLRWVEIVNLGQWMLLISQSLEFSWGFLESMLVRYLLAMTKGTGPLNMRESRTYSQLACLTWLEW